MNETTATLARLAELRIVPVVEVESADAAVPLAQTLADVGLPVMEVTLRTPTALEVIERVAAECPDVLVGAGTVLDAAMVHHVHAAGARFAISPGLSPACLAAADEVDLPFIPGVVTPSEAIAALNLGVRHLKFFPAEAHGGVPSLKALAGPLAATGVQFMPTGGISRANAGDYLRMSSVFAVGGTWIAPSSDVTAHRWHKIAERARAARELLRNLGLEVAT